MNESNKKTVKNGFTIVEIVVVIVIIGILATVGIVQYGNWRKSVNTTQVKSDLNGVASAMETTRTFKNLYPAILPSSITASNGVSLSGGGSADGKTYCVDGASLQDPSITYYVDSSSGAQGIQPGTCASRSVIPAIPANLAVVSTASSQINLSWSSALGATSYMVQCATDTLYTAGVQQSTVATTTGSLTGLNSGVLYYCHVKSTNGIGSSGWSGNVTATPTPSVVWTERTSAGAREWYSFASSTDGTKLVAGAYDDYIYTSTDSGATWTARTSAGTKSWYTLASSSDGTKLIAGSNNGYVYTSADSGATWTQRTFAGSSFLYHVASSSDGTKLTAAVMNGYVYTSADSGATWTQRTSLGLEYWNSLASSSDGTKLFVGQQNGYMYTSTDSGSNWTKRIPDTQDSAGRPGWDSWHSMSSSADGNKLVAIGSGYIYTSTDSGATWTTRTSAGWRNWGQGASSSDGTKLAAVEGGAYVWNSNDSGATWKQQPTGYGVKNWFGFAMSPNGAILILGALNGGPVYTGINTP